MKRILTFSFVLSLSACATLDNVQYYHGPAKARSEVAVFTAKFPAAFRRINFQNYTECGQLSVNGSASAYSFELLPGTYRYSWTGVAGKYSQGVEGNGQITVAKNEVYVLACGAHNYHIIKLPVKLTATKIKRPQVK